VGCIKAELWASGYGSRPYPLLDGQNEPEQLELALRLAPVADPVQSSPPLLRRGGAFRCN